MVLRPASVFGGARNGGPPGKSTSCRSTVNVLAKKFTRLTVRPKAPLAEASPGAEYDEPPVARATT